ncbi:hypothetical protein [Bacteroides eggerthii]|uniref:hypothetical protein n=1 Tax=Bacteroides eggerthii TaxID=28111 RepID=UPI0035643760
MFKSNRTLTARFEQNIRDNIIGARFALGPGSRITVEVSADYPIASPITISYSAQGTFTYYDDSHEPSQPPIDYFSSRIHTKTLNVGESEWEFWFIPDVSPEEGMGMPSDAILLTISSAGIDFNNFSDSQYNYICAE